MINNVEALGVSQVLVSVGGLTAIGYIGQGVMEELGWRRMAAAWGAIIYVSGAVVVIKFFMDGIKAAMGIVSGY